MLALEKIPENCFQAFIRVKKADELVQVDARPSDAINLAVVCNVPILVSEIALRIYEKSQSKGEVTATKTGEPRRRGEE